jgi:tripartite-type tricarboxylate transporter receptor subunit TctC
VLHPATDADTGRIVSSALTGRDADDGSQVGPLLDQADGPVPWRRSEAAMRRRSLALALGSALLARPGRGQEDWPAGRPIRLVVPFVAGASSDTIARLVAARLGGPLGTGIVVENRAGAGGLVAAQTVARAPPDGTTLLWSGETALIQAVLQRDPGYDALRDFVPIATIVDNPALLCVRPAAPWRDIAAMLDAARAQGRGGLRYGSGGVGTPAHMAAAAMLRLAGAEGTHVPYRGANQAALAVEQGEVDFAFAISNIALPRMRQGAIRVLLGTGARRTATLPDLPTLAGTLPGGPVITSGSSIVGPAGIPASIAARLHAAVGQIVTGDAALRAALTRDGGEVTLTASPEAYAAGWAEQFSRLQRLVELSGARAE